MFKRTSECFYHGNKKNMNPDQIVSQGQVWLISYCLEYRLSKYISADNILVANGEKRVITLKTEE